MTTTLTVCLARHTSSCQIQVDIDETDTEQLNAKLRQIVSVCEDTLETRIASGHPQASSVPLSGQNSSGPRMATEKQVKAIRAMAKRQGIELSRALHDRYGASSLNTLTIREASQLIDELKQEPAVS